MVGLRSLTKPTLFLVGNPLRKVRNDGAGLIREGIQEVLLQAEGSGRARAMEVRELYGNAYGKNKIEALGGVSK